jgi:hypothetical protein
LRNSESCSTSKAFVDTTVLADALLAKGIRTQAALAAVKRYSSTLLPIYAIKEFKAGALRNYSWAHNKLVESPSLSEALEFINRTRGYRSASAQEAIKSAVARYAHLTTGALVAQYGQNATLDPTLKDLYRLHLKRLVIRAWQRRRRIAKEHVFPLSCYTETAPREERGLIVVDTYRCEARPECALGPILKSDLDALRRLREAAKTGGRPEDMRRSVAIRSILKRPSDPISDEICRNLGDAMIVFLSPSDAIILTTNTRDHTPLGAALGKSVEKP